MTTERQKVAIRAGQWAQRHLDELLEAAVERDGEHLGYCVLCGEEHYGIEGDGRYCPCVQCNQDSVFGAEELIMYGA